jgi:hypothetical protein
MQRIMGGLTSLGRLIQKAGPYLLLEILLPGGTAIAFLLFLYRSGRLHCGGIAMRVPARAQVHSRVASPSLSEMRIRDSIYRKRIPVWR